MSESRNAKRPAPDAYDHLWSLLPVFVAFFAMLVYIAADDRSMPHAATIDSRPASMPATQHSARSVAEPSAPAETALATLPDGVAEPIATF